MDYTKQFVEPIKSITHICKPKKKQMQFQSHLQWPYKKQFAEQYTSSRASIVHPKQY